MSKENKDQEFDFNIDGIFGGFETSVSSDKETEIKEIPEEFISNDDSDDSEEKDLEDESIEVEETKEEEDDKDTSKDDEEEISEIDDDSIEEDKDIEYSYKALANFLAEEGAIDFEDSEDIEDTPDIIKDAVFNTAKNMVEEYKESIPEEGKDFLDYLEKGGDPSKYFQSLERPIDFNELNLEDDKNQKRVVGELLKSQGYSDDEIKETIQDYEDGLILEKQAKLASKKLEKVYEKKKEQLIASQQKEIEDRNKNAETYINEIKNTISTSDSLGGLSINNSDKKSFEKYLLQRDKEGLTQYEKELKDNPIKTQLELAYLKFKKFNFAKVANKVKTDEARRIKGLVKSKDATTKGGSKRVKSVDETGSDFSAFESFL